MVGAIVPTRAAEALTRTENRLPEATVLQAAIDGHGIALAHSVMAHDDLAAGRLVRLFPEIGFASVLVYYVIYRPETASLPRLRAFRNWLFEEAQPYRRSRAKG